MTSEASKSLSDDELDDLSHSAVEEALSFGLDRGVLLRYFKTIRNRGLASDSAARAEPVAWWNGIRRADERDMTTPSFSESEDTWHDIPVYSGVNPCNLVGGPSRAEPVARERILRDMLITTALRAYPDKTKSEIRDEIDARLVGAVAPSPADDFSGVDETLMAHYIRHGIAPSPVGGAVAPSLRDDSK